MHKNGGSSVRLAIGPEGVAWLQAIVLLVLFMLYSIAGLMRDPNLNRRSIDEEAKEEDEELAVIEPDRVDDSGAKVVPADHHRCAMQARQWAGAWAFVSKKARL